MSLERAPRRCKWWWPTGEKGYPRRPPGWLRSDLMRLSPELAFTRPSGLPAALPHANVALTHLVSLPRNQGSNRN